MQLSWLPVNYRIEYKIVLFTYKALKFVQPRYHADVMIHKQQDRATRSEGQHRLHQPVSNMQTSSRGIRYAALSIWNLLPNDLRINEMLRLSKLSQKQTCSCISGHRTT